MQTSKIIIKSLRAVATKERAEGNKRFFKTGKGEYGEGDKFLGVTVPEIRKVVRVAKDLGFDEVLKLLDSPLHEVRLCGALIFVAQFEKGSEALRKKIFTAYMSRIKASINNWDIVDTSAPQIVGAWLYDKSKAPLTKLAKSKNLWERRVAILSTFYFIRKKECSETFRIADLLMHDREDLIHKAVGWMLREVGKSCGMSTLEKFLRPRITIMPRTMLRYAIEKFPEGRRKEILASHQRL